MSDSVPIRRENRLLVGIFCAALLSQFYFTTSNWTSGFMPGHEFRQTQTAIVSYYIDAQNNFSLLYETPVVGKPWVSVLLEVPVYEWSVVLLSRALRVPHFIAARTVSLACFYLALPALYLLLGRLRLPPARRLLVLALILTCPVYIFYSRAFLMESMELMCCAWFLLGVVRTMDGRRWTWLAFTILAGTGASLIKSVTFAVWLLPAAGYVAWQMGRDLRDGRRWRAALATMGWGLATVAVPLGALRWWITLTDPIKAAHASAWLFTSKNLSQGNWGLLEIAGRFSPRTWHTLLERWQEAIMPPWVVLLGLAAGVLLFPAARWRVVGLAGVFFAAQLMFPFAYAWQDYYFYACTVFLLAALGWVLLAMLDSRLPRWGGWLVVAVLFLAQLSTYWLGYHTYQILKSDGGFQYTRALRDLAPKDSVFIIAGADWAPIIPYYTQHKALMIRSGLENDPAYLSRAFEDLADEDVSALILVGPQRENQQLLERVANRYGMERTPTFSHPGVDVYFTRYYDERIQTGLQQGNYPFVTYTPLPKVRKPLESPFRIPPSMARDSFANISPAPFQAYFAFGLSHAMIDGVNALSAHPISDLWLHPPAGATRIHWEYLIMPAAYEGSGGRTDGVEFVAAVETADGKLRQIYRRLLDPVRQPADRGVQKVDIPYRPKPGETLRFSTHPNLGYAFDWAYWLRLEVK